MSQLKEISNIEFSFTEANTNTDGRITSEQVLEENNNTFITFFEENWKPVLKWVYLAVALFLLSRLLIHIVFLCLNYLKSDKSKFGKFTIIYTERLNNAFSFFNWIFIHKGQKSTHNIDAILIHEKIHASQYHSIDLIMIELLSAVMWFNPLVWMMRKSMQLVHEYLADEGALSTGIDRLKYQALLLNHVCEERIICLSSNFNHSLIKKRMLMISKSKLKSKTKLKILALIPVTSVLIFGVALVKGQSNSEDLSLKKAEKQMQTINSENNIKLLKIGTIQWSGNTVFTKAELSSALGLKTGDSYNKDDVNKRIWENENCIADRYFNDAYLFFNAEIKEHIANNTVSLEIKITEGPRHKFGKITISGNKKVPTKEILNALKIKTGQWFSKKLIVESIQSLQKMKKFDPDKIVPVPTPITNEKKNTGTVNIEFQVVEL